MDDTTHIWRQLETGDWSVIDQCDRDRRRYLLAQQSDRVASRPLSHRERQVVEYASRGWSNKVIAFELGVTPSTVSTHLTHAARKLGMASRAALIQTLAAISRRDAEVTFVGWAGKRFAVIAMPMELKLPAALSPAEREVVTLVVAGRSNAEIARARGVSRRTVENQLASSMKKLGASSRADLTAAVSWHRRTT
jgi:DNA-binding NarL/FixJ family response regulator